KLHNDVHLWKELLLADPTLDDIVTLAHELWHTHQDIIDKETIHAEVESYNLESRLKLEFGLPLIDTKFEQSIAVKQGEATSEIEWPNEPDRDGLAASYNVQPERFRGHPTSENSD